MNYLIEEVVGVEQCALVNNPSLVCVVCFRADTGKRITGRSALKLVHLISYGGYSIIYTINNSKTLLCLKEI